MTEMSSLVASSTGCVVRSVASSGVCMRLATLSCAAGDVADTERDMVGLAGAQVDGRSCASATVTLRLKGRQGG